MSAFGSYGGEEVVDFSKIKGGLFLISGDTGSGKTTIFDGIMYALYNKLGGDDRETKMMRSEYADDKEKLSWNLHLNMLTDKIKDYIP